jgi:hypothetical protein
MCADIEPGEKICLYFDRHVLAYFLLYFSFCVFKVKSVLFIQSYVCISDETSTVEPLITDTAGEFKFCPL